MLVPEEVLRETGKKQWVCKGFAKCFCCAVSNIYTVIHFPSICSITVSVILL